MTSAHIDRNVWEAQLGPDLDWSLSFEHLSEKDTTKHVHRLHPYKGKFIPQLVEHFLKKHFKSGDIILDPFSGSGTTLVQAAEMGIHSIGIDVSDFNCLIADTKMQDCYIDDIREEAIAMFFAMEQDEFQEKINPFNADIGKFLKEYNAKHFPKGCPTPENVDELVANAAILARDLMKKHNIPDLRTDGESFMDVWYNKAVRKQIETYWWMIKCGVDEPSTFKALQIILSRTMRSCRSTPHYNLGTLKEPVHELYYCWKHKKICKPLYSINAWFRRHAIDTVTRLREFKKIKGKNPSNFSVLPVDARSADIGAELNNRNEVLFDLVRAQKIRGIFTSPPYVGQIDYHEQHAYAYELFALQRLDGKEIGPKYKGQSRQAKAEYITDTARALRNCSSYLADDYDVFLVANDKFNLYPEIATQAGMKIVDTVKRPVLNRSERDRKPYAEFIFHMKEA